MWSGFLQKKQKYKNLIFFDLSFKIYQKEIEYSSYNITAMYIFILSILTGYVI